MNTHSNPTPVGTRCCVSLALSPTAAPSCQRCVEVFPPADGKMSGPRTARPYRSLAVFALLLLTALPARSQWLTQTNTLKPGWNAVYLHVDASHNTLDNLVGAAAGNKIKEIWLWQPPASTMQFTTTPQQPSTPNSQWAVWDSSAIPDTLTRLVGNAAYLVNNTNTVDYVWALKGRPVPPRYQWTTTGLNFLGFPTPAPTSGTLNFDNFLGPAPEFQSTAEIYRYPGGSLGATNPVRVFPPVFRNTFVKRGEAFWIRSGADYNRYYGPVEVNLQNSAGVTFGDALGTYSVRLKNVTTSSRTVTMSLLASESVPVTTPAQPAIAGTPPLLVRGALNTANLTYGSATLSAGGATNFTLAAKGQPGSELEVVLGLNRGLMTQPAGSLYAGTLRFADTGGLEQIDVPVTASVGSTAGLWVGAASVSSVNHYLKSYANTNTPGSVPITDAAGFSVTNLPGYLWTPQPAAGNRTWSSVASSADGSKLVASAANGQIYTSTDYGTNWTARASALNWASVASSADGVKLVAVVNGGQIYTSGNTGVTWTAQAGSAATNWTGIASSADGVNLVAVANNGQLYTSANSGVAWTARTPARAWTSVASSADGNNAVAAVTGGQIYTSTDSGANWTARASIRNWSSVASSANGVRLVAASTDAGIFTSKDSGASWANSLPGTNAWKSVASSADGFRLVAVANGGTVYYSSDAGANWAPKDTTRAWQAVASSGDGTRLLAGVTGGALYTSTGTFTSLETDASGRILARSASSAPYLATGTNIAPGSVARPFPLRLILHNNGLSNGASTNVNLLQRVYHGQRFTNTTVVATQEAFLDVATLGTARRISATHLPFSHTNAGWPRTSGTIGLGSSLVFNLTLGYDDHTSNPFLHRYHPDHDNLGTDFKTVQLQGVESYRVSRQITLTFAAPATDFASLTAASTTLGGTYAEVVTFYGSGSNSRQFTIGGTFTLNRISPIATLTTQ